MDWSKGPWIVAMCLILALFTGGCAGKESTREKITFYTLEYEAPSMEELEGLDCTVRIERFSTTPGYNTRCIVYRDHPYIREEYFYHRWRANPADLVGQFLARDLKKSGLFGAVLEEASSFPVSFLLEGSVDEFLEVDTEEDWKAQLEVTVALLVEDEPDITRKVIFQKGFRGVKACKEKNPAALAEAMSMAMREVSGKIIREVHRRLREYCAIRR